MPMDEFTQGLGYSSQPSEKTIQQILNYSKSIAFIHVGSAELPNELKLIYKN
tara:strand:+ start:12978 stop:13133 length:156 start_codon:yes stop_codon:yes gene_type:complete